MPGDIYTQAKPGEPLNIPAALFNKLVKQAQGLDLDASGKPATFGRSQTVAKVRNDTGAELDQFAIVGLDEPLILPADSEVEFARQVTFSGVVPDEVLHYGSYGVLLGPLAEDAFGEAVVAGVVPVWLTVDPDIPYLWAHVDHEESGGLLAYPFGSARILWVDEPDEDDGAWAIVRLGDASPGQVKGKLSEELAFEDSATMRIWEWDGADEVNTGVDITVHDWFLASGQSVASGTQLWASQQGVRWYAIQRQCA